MVVLGQRDALIQPEQSRSSAFELNGHRDVCHLRTQFRRQAVERPLDHVLELTVVHVDHLPIVRAGAGSGCVHVETVQLTAMFMAWPKISITVTNSHSSFRC